MGGCGGEIRRHGAGGGFRSDALTAILDRQGAAMRLVPPTLAAFAVALLGPACAPADEPAASREAGPASSAAAAAAGGPDLRPPVVSAEVPPCSTGRTKAVTGVCDDGAPGLFLAVTDHIELGDKCVWLTEQLMLSAGEALVFRSQDCSAQGWTNAAYAFADGKVRTGDASTPYAIDRVILEIFPATGAGGVAAAALDQLAAAPEAERATCAIRLHEGFATSGTAFQLAPTAGGQGCGPYGAAPGLVFWEARDGRALFHRIGSETGYWDPASFTFYRPDAAGVWRKAG
jgi:hypothetical protein